MTRAPRHTLSRDPLIGYRRRMDWTAILAAEGTPTGDGRLFELNSITWRDLPLTLLYMPATDDGHDGSFPIGSIVEVERVGTGEGTANIVARGTWAEVAEAGEVAEALAMIRGGHVRGVSVDVGLDRFMVAPMDEGLTLVDKNGEPVGEDAGDEDAILSEGDAAWLEIENVVTLRVMEATIMAATVVATPAFAEAMIEPLEAEALVAAGAPSVPPADWFTDPHLDGPTPLTIRGDGRVYGHLASWGTCHIGMPGCFQPPTSATDYALFRLGERETDHGPVAVGQITLDTNHAAMSDGSQRAREHYEHTGAAVADVASGEDPHGIWVAGALRPGVTGEQVAALRAAKLSGDWRAYQGNLELVGALAVNVPGFPVPRGVLASGGDEPVALVAAGALRCATKATRLAGRITKVRSATAAGRQAPAPNSPERADALAARADRLHAPDLERLQARAVEPVLRRLAERV